MLTDKQISLCCGAKMQALNIFVFRKAYKADGVLGWDGQEEDRGGKTGKGAAADCPYQASAREAGLWHC